MFEPKMMDFFDTFWLEKGTVAIGCQGGVFSSERLLCITVQKSHHAWILAVVVGTHATGNQYSGMEKVTFLHLTHSGVGYRTTQIGIEAFMCEIEAWPRVTLV